MILYKKTGIVLNTAGASLEDFDIPYGCHKLGLGVFITAISGAGAALTMVGELKDENNHYYTTFAASGGQILSGAPNGYYVDMASGYPLLRTGRLRYTFAGTTPSATMDFTIEGEFTK